MSIQINTDNYSPIINVNTDNTNPSVVVDNVTQNNNPVSTNPLFGPKGDKGDKGDIGAQGPQGEQGIQGETGNGIASIDKTSTSGLVDTYTITYTNGDTDAFTVTNGKSPSTYIHEQAIASDEWVIEHNLNKMPTITLIDQFGKEFDAEKEYPTGFETTKVIIHLNGATTGRALLN